MFKKISNTEIGMSFIGQLKDIGGWVIVMAGLSGGGLGAYYSTTIDFLNAYSPFSWYFIFLLCSLIAIWSLVGIKYIFSFKGKTTKFIPNKNKETFIRLKKLNGEISTIDANNIYPSFLKLNGEGDNRLNGNKVNSENIVFVTCIFHDYIQTSYVRALDSEGNDYPLVLGNYSHMHSTFVILGLDEGKSITVKFT